MPKIKFSSLDEFGLMTEMNSFDSPKNQFNYASNVSFRNGNAVTDHQYIEMAEYHFKSLMSPNEYIKRVFRFDTVIYYITNFSVYCSVQGNNSRDEYTYAVSLPDKSFKGVDNGFEPFALRVGKYFMITLGKGEPFITSLAKPVLAKPVPGWMPGWEINGGLALINNLIVCAGKNKATDTYNNKVFWSNFAYDDEMPTLWDPTVTENNSSGFNTFAEFNKIYGLLKSGDSLMIYADTGTKSMSYVGGDDIFAFRDLLEHDFPVRGFNSIARTRKGHVMITNDDVVMHNGVQASSIIGNVRNRILDVIRAPDTDTRVIFMSHRDELLIVHKPNQSFYYENGFICNLSGNPKWSSTTFPPLSDFIYDSDIYNQIVSGIDDITGAIDDLSGSIDALGIVLDKYALFGFSDFKPYRLFSYSEDSSPVTFEISKEFIDFDDMGSSHEQVKQVLAIFPQVFSEDVGAELFFHVGVSNVSQGTITWQQANPFKIAGIKDKSDFRCSGKYVSFRITGKSKKPINISSFLLDFNIRSGR